MSSSVKGEVCARFGGDEFCVAVVIPASGSECYFSDFKERFLDYLYDYNRKSDKPYIIKASIGCCIEKADSSYDLEDMIKRADERMYADKISHKRKR